MIILGARLLMMKKSISHDDSLGFCGQCFDCSSVSSSGRRVARRFVQSISVPSVPSLHLCLDGGWVGLKIVAVFGSRRFGAPTCEDVVLKVVLHACSILHDGWVGFVGQLLGPAALCGTFACCPTWPRTLVASRPVSFWRPA